MKSSGYYQRCVQNLRKVILPPDLSQEEQLMESHSAPLQVLPQSKLIENTTKYIQDKLNLEKLGQDWTVKLLSPMRYNESKSQYFPT